MTTLDSKNEESRLDEVAAEWLFERDEGFAAERAKEFQHWCNRDPRHAAAVARVESMLGLLDETPEFRGAIEARVPRSVLPPKAALAASSRRINHRPWAWAAGLAAALVLGTMAGWIAVSRSSTAEVFAADGSEPRRVALADGSVVDLNSNSNLQVKFSEGQRRITLDAGEAHFQVARNAARPFIVSANGVSVRAVGTAFNIRIEGGKVEVLVTEGKVEVDRQSTMEWFGRSAPIIPILSAGNRTQIVTSLETAPTVEALGSEKIHSLLSWQDRMTGFTDVPLREMVARINRCSSIQLVFENSELGDRRIGGVIALNQPEAFVHFLEQYGDIIAERRGNEIFLRRAR